MRNQYPGTCYRCHKHVARGAGHFEKSSRGTMQRTGIRWFVLCAECAIIGHQLAKKWGERAEKEGQ